MLMPWSVPRQWEGRTAFILGGGPSLALVDLAELRDRGAVIAINDAGLLKAPWADVHYFADPHWAEWHHTEFGFFTGRYRVTRNPVDKFYPAFDIRVLDRERLAPLSRDPRRVAGPDSGSNAINLAFLFGAARIVLFGFDMRPGHWHDRHRRATPPTHYAECFMPAIAAMAIALKREGIEVVNATPGSALKCFPVITPAEALMGAA